MESGTLIAQEIVPRRLFEGVYQLLPGWDQRYLVRTEEGNILIDTPPGEEEVFAAIEMLGGARWLFLTHRHTAGDAWMFYKRLGLHVVIHPDDAEHVTGCPVDVKVHDGDHLTPETRVIHAPGHSPGSCALILDRAGGILFTGDIVITDEHGDLRLPLDGYSEAPRRAHNAVSRLLRHPFAALLPAHGAPLLTGAEERLRDFVAHQ